MKIKNSYLVYGELIPFVGLVGAGIIAVGLLVGIVTLYAFILPILNQMSVWKWALIVWFVLVILLVLLPLLRGLYFERLIKRITKTIE